ncbi:MAG: putative molybdenum carrier protein [Candidatus Riflebacteria bacterium]|nr:putative molybdenum carrier protein [Candidatus Riflebacteria bacterium]
MNSLVEQTSDRRFRLGRLISGGQTGVDRMALDTAMKLGICVAGWCPAGRLSETGPIPALYPLIETTTPRYAARTRMNVRDSDATLIFTWGTAAGGTALSATFAKAMKRPHLMLDMQKCHIETAVDELLTWLKREQPTTLNVAGPRATEAPELMEHVRNVLTIAVAPVELFDAPPWPPPSRKPVRPRTLPLPDL